MPTSQRHRGHTVKPRHSLTSGLKAGALAYFGAHIAEYMTGVKVPELYQVLLSLIATIGGCTWKTISLEITLTRNGKRNQ